MLTTTALLALSLATLGRATPLGPLHQRQNPCTRAILRANVADYISAQASGDPSSVIALAAGNTTYTEDFYRRNLTTGVLSTPLIISHNRSLLDTTQCATYTELISAPANVSSSLHRVIGTQMRFDATGTTLLRIDSLVTQPGDWAFNASGTLRYAAREDGLWTEIAQADQDKRETIQAAGDAYLDLFNNASVVVPWGTPCHRLEGGFYTGNGSATDSCNVGVPSGVVIKDRRYVIDEVLGSVDCFVTFGSRPDSHEFRVEVSFVSVSFPPFFPYLIQ